MLSDYFKYSLNNMRKRRLRSWLTMLGIFIGIASVVALIGLGQGLEQAILGEFSAIGSDKISVSASGGFGPPGSSSVSQLTMDDVKVVRNVKGFDIVTYRILKSSTLEFQDAVEFPFVVSLPMEEDGRAMIENVMQLKVVSGRMLKPSDSKKVVITQPLSEDNLFKRKIQVGDSVLVYGEKFDVVGIITMAGFGGGKQVLMNEPVLRDLFDLDDFVSIIIAKVRNIDNIDSLQKTLERKLRNSRGVKKGEEDFDVSNPKQTLETFKSIIGIVQGIVIGIAAISLLVGAIGVMNTMYTAVLERRKEIGIMKSVGARNNDILTIFVLESGLMGLVGGGIGILVGVGLAKLVEIGSAVAMGSSLIQTHFEWWQIFAVLLFSFLLGVVSGYFPAKQAAALKPVKALRGA